MEVKMIILEGDMSEEMREELLDQIEANRNDPDFDNWVNDIDWEN